jgi:tetratricopeptide (TPR) repeat protein
MATAMLVMLAVPDLVAQQLPLKTAAPPGSQLICTERQVPTAAPTAAPADRSEAARLTNAATQAMILGDLGGALDFLDRALRADPTATEAVYLRARILQQQGAREAAADALCEYLRLEPDGPSAEEVRRRLDEARDEGVGGALLGAYRRALALELEGRLEEAEAAFTEVVSARPAATTALYNRGVVRAALGRSQEAQADLLRYLELEPAAPDEPDVQRYVAAVAAGRFAGDQAAGDHVVGDPFTGAQSGVQAGTAFLTGALVPGGGQFYTGRPVLGLTVTGLVIGAVAVGALYQRTTVDCLDAVTVPCPEELIASRDTERPLMGAAIGVAVGLALAAAVEAALHAGRHSQQPAAAPAARVGASKPASGGRISHDGSALRLELVRWHF